MTDVVGFLIFVISAGIMAGTPILLASLGEILGQRAGVMNIGVEGTMLTGAVLAFIFTNIFSNRWLGMLFAMLICAVINLVLGFLLIHLRANQVATGMAYLIFSMGLSSILGKAYLGTVAADYFKRFELSSLDAYPKLQQFLSQDEIVLLALVLAVSMWFILFRTKWGLYVRAAGENPSGLDCVGVNIFRIRYISFVVGGMMCAMAGAYLSTGYNLFWIENMTAGQGWMAIALVNFSLWNPLLAVAGSYLFGIFHILSLRLETLGVGIPSYFLRMIPYFLPIIILIFVRIFSKSRMHLAPSALGKAYIRESR
jgi:simple sugar transport system permease protein